MGRYFGREPRYSREEIERQAQEAIDARVSLGRPPDEDFRPLEARLAETDRALAVRPAEIDRALSARPAVEPLPAPQPLQIREIRVPTATSSQAAQPAKSLKPAEPKAPRAARRPAGARQTVN